MIVLVVSGLIFGFIGSFVANLFIKTNLTGSQKIVITFVFSIFAVAIGLFISFSIYGSNYSVAFSCGAIAMFYYSLKSKGVNDEN